MLKEIHEQPECLHNAFRGRLLFDEATTRLDGLALTDSELRRITNIKILGCGTSWHASLVGKYLFEELARVPTEVDLRGRVSLPATRSCRPTAWCWPSASRARPRTRWPRCARAKMRGGPGGRRVQCGGQQPGA